MENLKNWTVYYLELVRYYVENFWMHIQGNALVWLVAAVIIPVVTVFLLFLLLADDFWQLIRLRLDVSRSFGDFFKVFILLLVAGGGEVFSIFMLIKDVL